MKAPTKPTTPRSPDRAPRDVVARDARSRDERLAALISLSQASGRRAS